MTDDLGDNRLTQSDIYRWPSERWVTGDVDDLADLCEVASAPPVLIEQQTEWVSDQLISYASALDECLDDATKKGIANVLGQESEPQALRLACCIWMTSCRLHDELASEKGPTDLKIESLRSIRQREHGLISLTALQEAWEEILRYNYRSIFRPALAALNPGIPPLNGAEVLDGIARLAEQVNGLRLGHSVDFAGELFPKLLVDRSEIAAYYTLPASAELLANLAVHSLCVADWRSSEQVSELRIADHACGTGALLRASYARIRALHDAVGGDVELLHETMMQHSITGLDINALATHMTAAGLSGMEIAVPFHDSRIGSVGLADGRTGSLDLLTRDEVVDITGEAMQLTEREVGESKFFAVPHESQDLVIQNPPYTRARGGRKLFDMAGMTEMQMKASRASLERMLKSVVKSGNRMPNSKAGFASHFSALADVKLVAGGVFATVLPLTAAHAESWEGFRREIAARYSDIAAIAMASDTQGSFSADTSINELLLIARKVNNRADVARGRILSVNLFEPPATTAEATYVAKAVRDLEDSHANRGRLECAGRVAGTWSRFDADISGFPWAAIGMRNENMARGFTSLLRSRLVAPGLARDIAIKLQFVRLGSVVRVGPTHHLIGHLRGNSAIGAFKFDPIEPGDPPVYPSLWTADAGTHTSMMIQPSHSGEPTDSGSPQNREVRSMWNRASRLFISRNMGLASQALAAATTAEPCMGGRAWTSLSTKADGLEESIAVWLNCTLGLLIRWGYAQTTQSGRATMQVRAIKAFPVPNFAADTSAARHARAVAEREFPRLAALTLRPAAYAWIDDARKEIDAVVLQMLDIDTAEARDAVDMIRRLWCREPSVHGGKKELLRKLGIK